MFRVMSLNKSWELHSHTGGWVTFNKSENDRRKDA